MSAGGIDLSDRSVKYVALGKRRGGFFIRGFKEYQLSSGIVEKGEVLRKNDFIDFLKKINHDMESRYIVVSLPEEKAFLSRIKLPLMGREQIRESLELQLEEYIPFSAGEAIFDFDVIKESEENLYVNFTAFPKSLVEDYRDSFMEAGFTPLVFEMEMQAAARVLVPYNDVSTEMLVDFGRTRTTFAIVSNGLLQFTSTINIAGEDLDKMLIKNLQVDRLEAEKIKKEKGFVKNKENEKIFDLFLPVLSTIKDEIGKHISYWNNHSSEYGSGDVSKIKLCGGDANLTGLQEYLSYELKLPVELGNPWINMFSFEKYIPEINMKESLVYTTAIGLALRATEYI